MDGIAVMMGHGGSWQIIGALGDCKDPGAYLGPEALLRCREGVVASNIPSKRRGWGWGGGLSPEKAPPRCDPRPRAALWWPTRSAIEGVLGRLSPRFRLLDARDPGSIAG